MLGMIRFPARLTTSLAPLAAAALLAAAPAFAAGPTTQFSVTGAVVAAKTYGLASLSALPAVTQDVKFTSGSGTQSHTYTGAILWDVLGGGANIVVNGNKNDVLNRYVLATGSDGYQTVFSLGELHPSFGNRPDLVAYAETTNGVSAPLGAEGFTRVTAPGDVKGGRYVSNLANLDVRASGSTATATGGGVSTQFSVTGDVKADKTFDLAALQAISSDTTVGGHTYSGVSFWDLLNTAVGIDLNPNVKNDVLGKYVVATGSDGYKSVFSLGELNPGFGNQPDMIVYAVDGVSIGGAGFARVVALNDTAHGRWVSNLVSLEVMSAVPVPEPGTYALMLLGLAAVGGVARRRRVH